MRPIVEQPALNHDQSADDRAIRDIVSRAEAAWNAGDAAGFCAAMADDIDVINVVGERKHGREAVERGHRHAFGTIYKGNRTRLAVEDIRFVRPEVAIAFIHARLISRLPPGAVTSATRERQISDEMHESEARTTMIFAKHNGRWQMIALQNTSVAPTQTALA